MEVEPHGRDREEQHHRDELRSVAQEHSKVRDRAEKEQHDSRQRVEGMDIPAFDHVERPLFTEHDHIEGHVRVA